MGQTKVLRLKSEKYGGATASANVNPVAQVLVQSSVFHLEELLDYLVPETLSEAVQPGVQVKVFINDQPTMGYVVSRSERTDHVGRLRFIEKVISPFPVLTRQLHDLISAVALRYAARKWDVIRSAIPERVAYVEKEFASSARKETIKGNINLQSSTRSLPNINLSSSYKERVRQNEKIRWAFNTGTLQNPHHVITEIISCMAQNRQCLIVVPDKFDIDNLADIFATTLGISPLQLGSHLDKSERYRNYLHLTLNHPEIVIGTRSAIFAPLDPNSLIIILADNDESMYEKHAPGWNVRDVALMRARDQSLIFIANALSLELIRLVDLGWLELIPLIGSSRRQLRFADLRTSDRQVIASGLTHGSVLVSVADPGFIPGLVCQKCRNIALCHCGGKLIIIEKESQISCSACLEVYLNWSCSYCSESKVWAIKRGAKRIAQELGKAFPGTSVLISTGEKRICSLPDGTHLVIATVGCEPQGWFAAACLMDGEIFFNRTGLRAQERARDAWARIISQVNPDGAIYIDLPNSHAISQYLLQGSPAKALELEIRQRDEVHLPPNFRFATLTGPDRDIIQVITAVEQHTVLEAIGPISQDPGRSKILLKVPTLEGQVLTSFLFDLQRYRSLKGLPVLTVRIDPFDL